MTSNKTNKRGDIGVLCGLLFLFWIPLVHATTGLELRVPHDLPVKVSAARADSVNVGKMSGDRYDLDLTNGSEASILALVFKEVCAPANKEPLSYSEARVATSEFYFYPGYGGSAAPIEAGETRPVTITVFQRFGPGSRCALVPFSVLFEDGTSWGVREPYATTYVSVLHTWIEGHEGATLDPENQDLMHKMKSVANAIVTESNLLEMRHLRSSRP